MQAMQVMSALSQATRLQTFRLLVDALPEGVAAGDIAVAMKASPAAMRAHLAILSRAGLVRSERIGRTILYRADTSPAESLSEFLLQACDKGRKARAAPR